MTESNNSTALIVLIVILYIISPLDFAPGLLIDDIMVAIAGYYINKKQSENC